MKYTPQEEKILDAIKAIPHRERSCQMIYKAIEPYLLKYDREKMYEAVVKGGYYKKPDFTLWDTLDIVEATLSLHTPAPVGGESGDHLEVEKCGDNKMTYDLTCPKCGGDWKLVSGRIVHEPLEANKCIEKGDPECVHGEPHFATECNCGAIDRISHLRSCPRFDAKLYGEPQEKKCTCVAIEGHFTWCDLYQQPSLKVAPELPSELNTPAATEVANKYATGENILELAYKINALIRWCRAQQN